MVFKKTSNYERKCYRFIYVGIPTTYAEFVDLNQLVLFLVLYRTHIS